MDATMGVKGPRTILVLSWVIVLRLTTLSPTAWALTSEAEARAQNTAYNKLPGTVQTPHLAWAKPYYRGPIRALVVAPTWTQRETVELAQRLDLEYAPLMTSEFDSMYLKKQEYADGQIIVKPDTVDRVARERLQRAYDVILIGKQAWESIPIEFQYMILKQVHDGAGLVYVCPWDAQRIEPVFQRHKTQDKDRFLLTGIPLAALPVLNGLAPDQLLQLSEFGMGRVVRIDYHQQDSSPFLSLTPVMAKPWPLAYEYYQALLVKAVIWAARKEPSIQIRKMEPVPPLRLELALCNLEGETEALRLELAIRDAGNMAEGTRDLPLRLVSGLTQVALPLPPLKDGRHFLNIWVRRAGKIINSGATFVDIRKDQRITDLTLDRRACRVGDDVQGEVVLNQPLPEGFSLRVQMWDNFGRLLEEQAVKPVGEKAPFTLRVSEALSILLKIKACLYDPKGQLLSESSQEFPVAAPRGVHDFAFVMWSAYSENDYLADLLFKQFASLGVDADFTATTPERAWAAARANLQVAPYMFGTFGSWTDAEACQDNLRKPCLNDPAYRQGLVDRVKELAPLYNSLGIPSYCLTIQGALTRHAQEFCFCPTCTRGFQEYARRVYGTLEALNGEWGTKYSSWDEIRPVTLAEARKQGTTPQWADFRVYMEDVYTDLNVFCRTEIRKLDPDALVGFHEPQDATSYRGISWWRLLSALDACGLYLNPGGAHTDVPKEIVRSFIKAARKGTLFGGWVGCYGYGEGFNRAMPWRSLFHEQDSLWDWMGYDARGNGGWTALTPDLAPLPYFVQLTQEINEIKQGIGKLLLNSSRQHDGIAIHYSPLSVHAATIEPSKTNLIESQKSFIYSLEDLGLQYNFVANEQIENGELSRGEYKVLILPYAQALSSAETERIKQFVGEGGTLIADYDPGTMDEHCKRRSASPLLELFGAFEAGLKTTRYGKGTAVYLGDLLKPYVDLRREGAEKQLRAKLGAVLAAAGVRPRLQLRDASAKELAATETVVFRDSEAEYVCLLKDYTVDDLSPHVATIRFPRRAFIYDVRQNRCYGYVDEVTTEIAPAIAKVFAALPYSVAAVSVRVDKQAYQPGDAVSYRVTLKPSTGTAARHVFRLEVADPEGQRVKWYSANLLAPEGRYSGALRLCLNEKKGKWTLSVRDVVSGKGAAAQWTVQ